MRRGEAALHYEGRSHRDAGVAAGLARRGWSEDRIVEFLLRTPLAVGDKAKESGEGYARTTAQWAIAHTNVWGLLT